MVVVSRILSVKVMSQSNLKFKDDFHVVLPLSCFVGHKVYKKLAHFKNKKMLTFGSHRFSRFDIYWTLKRQRQAKHEYYS